MSALSMTDVRGLRKVMTTKLAAPSKNSWSRALKNELSFPLERLLLSVWPKKFPSKCSDENPEKSNRFFYQGDNTSYIARNGEGAKVNWGLEGTSDIMVTPKFGVGSILSVQFIIRISPVLGAGRPKSSVDFKQTVEIQKVREIVDPRFRWR